MLNETIHNWMFSAWVLLSIHCSHFTTALVQQISQWNSVESHLLVWIVFQTLITSTGLSVSVYLVSKIRLLSVPGYIFKNDWVVQCFAPEQRLEMLVFHFNRSIFSYACRYCLALSLALYESSCSGNFHLFACSLLTTPSWN